MSDGLSQEEIDKLLSGMSIEDSSTAISTSTKQENSAGDLISTLLSHDEIDTLGEISNISMGASATTLSTLLANKVDITTPTPLAYLSLEDVYEHYKGSILVHIKYTKGLNSAVMFVIKRKDAAIIANLMMGGDGHITSNEPEIGELELSAVGEALNQMMGTASTSMSEMFNTKIDISTPKVKEVIDINCLKEMEDLPDSPIVAVSFKLKIGSLIDSEMVQVMSVEAAKNEVSMLLGAISKMMDAMPETTHLEAHAPMPQAVAVNHGPQPSMPPPQTQYQGMSSGPKLYGAEPDFGQPVTVQPVQFGSFDHAMSRYGAENQNLNLLLDIYLELSVELGRTDLPIKKVLELTRGSIIELNRVAGEPVDLMANGKLIAKGEVVVIEDNFGIRITNIVAPEDRIKNLK